MESSVLEAASKQLAQMYDAPVQLVDAGGFETGSARTQVSRVALLVRPAQAPETAILKSFSSDADGVARYSSERAVLELLSNTDARAVAPRVLARGSNPRFLVLEDLGDGPSLADRLLGPDPAAAAVALEGYARALGQLNAATLGRAAEYSEIRGGQHASRGADDLELTLPSVARDLDNIFRQVGVVVSAATEDEVAAVISRVTEPGALAAVVQGDACPDNSIEVNGTMRLFDFEFAGMRHFGLDATSFRMFFPTCWCASRIPADLVRTAEATYRRELVFVRPALHDDAEFFGVLADAAAARLLYMLGTRLGRALDDTPLQDDAARGRIVSRRRMIWWLDSFGELAKQADSLPGLGSAAVEARRELERRWTMSYETLPYYPAFPGGVPWPQV